MKLIHYTNVFREVAEERIEEMASLNLRFEIGDPAPTNQPALLLGRPHTVEEIKRFGVVGLYVAVEDADARKGNEVVNDAWSVYFLNNPLCEEN